MPSGRTPLSIVPDVQVVSTPPSDYQNISSTPAEFGGLTGQAEQRVGAEGEQAGNNLTQIASGLQDRSNRLANTGAINQYQRGVLNITGGDPAKPGDVGYFGKQGTDAIYGYDDAAKSVDDLRTQIRSGLQNDQQRLLFDEDSRRYQWMTMESMRSHYVQQFKQYGSTLNTAKADIQDQDAAQNYNNDQRFYETAANKLHAVSSAVQDKFGDNADPALLQEAQSKALSGLIKSRFDAWMANDRAGAANWLKNGQMPNPYGKGMVPVQKMLDGPTLAELTGRVRSATREAAIAASIDSVPLGGVPGAPGASVAPQPQASNSAATNSTWQRMLTQEHGVDSQGNALVSPAGAIGIAQLEPATARAVAEKHGFDYDESALHTDQGYNHMIGRAYFGDLVKQYGGNLVLASAAYNAGPGRVDRWIQQNGDPRTGATTEAAWASKIPIDETRNYVSKVAQPSAVPIGGQPTTPGGVSLVGDSAAQGAGGVQPGATPVGPTGATHAPQIFGWEEETMRQVRAKAAQDFPDDSAARETVIRAKYQEIQEANYFQQKYQAETLKAREDARDGIMNNVLTVLRDDPTKFVPSMLDGKDTAGNYMLSHQEREHYMELATSRITGTQNKALQAYGSGFYTAFQMVHAAPGTPGRITTQDQLYPHIGMNGDLTIEGLDVLRKEIKDSQTPVGMGEGKMREGALAYGKHQISFEKDFGVFKMRDPKGEDAFNVGFLPAFFQAYEDGITGKYGPPKTPYQLLSKDSPDFIVDKLVSAYKRTPAQIAQDMLEENQDMNAAPPAPGATAQPAPPPPDPTTKAGIVTLFNTGKMTREQALQALIANGIGKPKPPSGAPIGTPATPTVPTDE